MTDSAAIVPILVTPVSLADPGALPHLTGVYVWNLNEFRKWAKSAISVIRELRSTFPGSGDLVWRATAAQKYRENGLGPEELIEVLKAQPPLTPRK